MKPSRLAACLIILATVLFGTGTAFAQAARQVPAETLDTVRQAMVMLEQIKASNMEPGWRANAAARGARTLARMGDVEAAKVQAGDATAILQQQARTAVPAAFGPGPVYTVLAQAFADLRLPDQTVDLVNKAAQSLQAVPDAAVRANVYPYLAEVLVALGDRGAATNAVLLALRSAAETQSARERTTSLSLVAIAQAKLGDQDSARDTIVAAREALAGLVEPIDRALGCAYVARAEAAIANITPARVLLREATSNYDKTLTADLSALQRVTTISMIALGQFESGDRNSARQTGRTLRQQANSGGTPYERYLSFIILADTLLQVEQR